MKKNDLSQNDFLADLMKEASLETPSDDFMENVMTGVEAMPAYQPRKKPFFLFIKSVVPWILLIGVFVLYYTTSDLPFTNYIPGKEYVQNVLLPSLGTFFTSFKELFSTKFFSISLAVLVSCGILFGLERLINRRSAHQHYVL
ncbi:MAG: hypothetical protein D4R67_04950 [Bacteroidetes bacterium]|nr:MAG: hypothetical protein D4R67_04950 [Bacteroidota bacterium]